MKLTVLASGSKANAAVLHTEQTNIMIDCGLSLSQLEARMKLAGIDPKSVSAILLTHEHADHTAGLRQWSRKYATPVYANRLTFEAMRGALDGHMNPAWSIFTEAGFMIKWVVVWPVEVWHDAADPTGFVFSDPSPSRDFASLAFLTDLGKVHQSAIRICERASTLFIEANYAEAMLETDKTRPWRVRERIIGPNGHLSNEGAAAAVVALPNLKKVILGHLSSATNHPDVARETVERALVGRNVEVEVAFTPECDRCKPPKTYDIL